MRTNATGLGRAAPQRAGSGAVPVPLAELIRRAFVPAWALGALLAAALVALRLTVDPSGAVAVAGTAFGALALYWLAYYALALDAGERQLVRGLARRER